MIEGSGSGRPKNMWIRIRYTAGNYNSHYTRAAITFWFKELWIRTLQNSKIAHLLEKYSSLHEIQRTKPTVIYDGMLNKNLRGRTLDFEIKPAEKNIKCFVAEMEKLVLLSFSPLPAPVATVTTFEHQLPVFRTDCPNSPMRIW
jgi:hypothetical protein